MTELLQPQDPACGTLFRTLCGLECDDVIVVVVGFILFCYFVYNNIVIFGRGLVVVVVVCEDVCWASAADVDIVG